MWARMVSRFGNTINQTVRNVYIQSKTCKYGRDKEWNIHVMKFYNWATKPAS